MELRDEPLVPRSRHQTHGHARRGQRSHVEVRRVGDRSNDRGDPRIGMRLPGGIAEPVADHPERQGLLRAVQNISLEPRDQADAGLEVFPDVRLAMLPEARRRPAAAREAQRRVPPRRHPVHAHPVQGEQRPKARILADHVDGVRDLDRPASPAFGAGRAGVLVVVAAVGGHCHDEPVLDERARQVGMNPRRPARAVGDHHEAPIPAPGRSVLGQLKREGATLHRLRVAARRVVDRDGPVALFSRDLGQAHRGLRRHREGDERGRED